MSDVNGNSNLVDESPVPEKPKKKERRPKLLTAVSGRLVSLAGIIERVVAQFEEEHGADSPALLQADSETKRLKLVRDAAQYVFAVESVQLSPEEQATVIQQVHSELFGYGPLDELLSDESITTIALEGADKVSVRYGPGGELESIDPIFEDHQHLRRMIKRILHDTRAELSEEQPIIEAGLKYMGRALSINVTGPPVTVQLSVDIRLHPEALPTLDDWCESGFMTTESAELLKSLVRSEHGIVIVGDTESGKTSLLSAMVAHQPTGQNLVAVERAGELFLQDGVKRLTVKWPYGTESGMTFGECIQQAISDKPDCLLLDEIRADEAEAIAPLLSGADMPRQIWTFRGASESKRIRSALGMVARRADPSQPEAMVQSLYHRLPFVIIVKKRRGKIDLQEIAEWQFNDSEYPDYVELMSKGWDGIELTGKRPLHELDLPENFWG